MATRAAAGRVRASVFSARVCRGTLNVIVRSLPATGLVSKIVTGGRGLGLALGRCSGWCYGLTRAGPRRRAGRRFGGQQAAPAPRAGRAAAGRSGAADPTDPPGRRIRPHHRRRRRSPSTPRPTVPTIGRAKSRVGASTCSPWMGRAPGIACTAEFGGRSSSVFAQHDRLHERLGTGVGHFLGVRASGRSRPTGPAERPTRPTGQPGRAVLSMPIRTTGRSIMIASPRSPSSSPRGAGSRRWLRRLPPSSCGCSTVGAQLLRQRPFSRRSDAVLR